MTVLPDGSCFDVMSFPLPKDHWIYAERQYAEGADEPVDLPAPILTHALREQVVAAVRYAVRGATMCGKGMDFDPDALVQNAVYALCGPYTKTTVIEDPRDKVIALCEAALTEVQDLIGETSGVYGLHLNGDNAPWNEIEQGGRFERLTTLPEALAAIDAVIPLPAAPRSPPSTPPKDKAHDLP